MFFDFKDFVGDLRISGITPHVVQNINTRSSSTIVGRTVRHTGHAQAFNGRKRNEQMFAWIKQASVFRQLNDQS